MAANSGETQQLLRRAASGDQQSWRLLVSQHRERLRRMIMLRLDQRLQGRLDASDVIQEVCLEAFTRLAEHLRAPAMPFHLWLRLLTGQRLVTLHRHHLGAKKRDVRREIPFAAGVCPEASSEMLACEIVGHESRPSSVAIRAELQVRIREALEQLDSLDREVLTMRHFEQLSRAEIAQLLGVPQATVSKRYFRALKRLKDILGNLPGGLEEL